MEVCSSSPCTHHHHNPTVITFTATR
jgi:hypothetical protein